MGHTVTPAAESPHSTVLTGPHPPLQWVVIADLNRDCLSFFHTSSLATLVCSRRLQLLHLAICSHVTLLALASAPFLLVYLLVCLLVPGRRPSNGAVGEDMRCVRKGGFISIPAGCRAAGNQSGRGKEGGAQSLLGKAA